MATRRFSARRSDIHGRGVFAVVDLAPGEYLLEYTGEVVTWEEACRRHQDEEDEGLTYLFDLDDGTVVDGSRGGNTARWINHGCDPNCETTLTDGRVLVHTVRGVPAGEELLIDYSLVTDGEGEDLDGLYRCACGSPRCRGTMLTPAD